MNTKDQGKEQQYTVAVQYWLPIWRAFQVEAHELEAAIEKAFAGAGECDGVEWREDYEGSGEYAVSCIARGAHENPYDAAPSDFLTVPARFRSATVDEVDHLPMIVEAARAVIQACGGHPPDWLATEVGQLAAAVAKAD